MRVPLGADLVIPVLALSFSTYFFYSISDLAWEAKANGVIIGTVLVLLVAIQLLRIGLQVAKGRASLGTGPLWQPREALPKRIGMVLITIAFIATIKVLGLTLGLFLGLIAALWVMGVRNWKVILGISLTTSALAYALFIAALNSNFPRGPIEQQLARKPGTDHVFRTSPPPSSAPEKRGLSPVLPL